MADDLLELTALEQAAQDVSFRRKGHQSASLIRPEEQRPGVRRKHEAVQIVEEKRHRRGAGDLVVRQAHCFNDVAGGVEVLAQQADQHLGAAIGLCLEVGVAGQ